MIKSRKKLLACAVVMAATVTFAASPVFAAEEEAVVISESASVAEVEENGTAAVAVVEEETVAENGTVEASVIEEKGAVETEDGALVTEEVIEAAEVEETPGDSRSIWAASRPSDDTIKQWIIQYEGKTVVSVNVKGASEDIIKPANVAVMTKPGATFTAGGIKRDLNRIYDTGFFYDLYPSFEEVPEGVAVTYNVQETPILTQINLVGNSKVEPTDTLMELVTMVPGKRLNRRTLQENIAAIQQKYVQDGYVMAQVYDLDVADDGVLTIRITEGVIEEIIIKGNEKTKDKVIRREMRCKVGEPLNKKEVVRSYQRINNLGFFETVDVKPSMSGVEPGAVVLEIDVKERNTGSVGFGAGYSSTDGFIGMISLGDRNFRGTGDAVKISYEFGGNDRDNRGWAFDWKHPWLDRKETSMMLRLYDRTYEYKDYDTEGELKERFMRHRQGFELTFGRPESEYTTNYISIVNRNDEYDSHKGTNGYMGDRSTPDFAKWREDNFGLTRSIGFSHVTDTRDNYQWPASGKRTSYGIEFAGLGGDFDYRKYTIEESRYYDLGKGRVLAIRAAYGYADNNLPEVDQFMVGGIDTVRGYRDNQFRGDNMLAGSIELRFPLRDKFKGALFLDGGGSEGDGLLPDTLHGSYGFGIMMDTPVGLLRLDVGHGEQGNRVHFNIGTGF